MNTIGVQEQELTLQQQYDIYTSVGHSIPPKIRGVIIHNWGRSTSTLDTVEDLNKLGVMVSFYDVMDAFNKLTEVKVYGGIEV